MKTYPYLDPATLEIASLADLPSQSVNMNQSSSFLGTQIQQIKANAAPLVVDSQAPLTVIRRVLPGGGLQFRVQFIAPTQAQDPNYQTTSILLSGPNGTTELAATSGAGPIIFNTTRSSVPGSVVLQQNNSNTRSETGIGTGNSKALVQT